MIKKIFDKGYSAGLFFGIIASLILIASVLLRETLFAIILVPLFFIVLFFFSPGVLAGYYLAKAINVNSLFLTIPLIILISFLFGAIYDYIISKQEEKKKFLTKILLMILLLIIDLVCFFLHTQASYF